MQENKCWKCRYLRGGKEANRTALKTTCPALLPVRREGEGNVVGVTQELRPPSPHSMYHTTKVALADMVLEGPFNTSNWAACAPGEEGRKPYSVPQDQEERNGCFQSVQWQSAGPQDCQLSPESAERRRDPCRCREGAPGQ